MAIEESAALLFEATGGAVFRLIVFIINSVLY